MKRRQSLRKRALRAHRRDGAVALVATFVLATGVAACSLAKQAPGAATAGHPLHAEQLAEVMRGFDAGVRQRVPAQTDLHDRWDGVFPAIADQAAALRDSAKALAGHPPKGLEIPERGRFATLAQGLDAAAARLEQAAARGDADAVESARAELGQACRACHARYRPDAPGLPEAFR